MKVEPAIWCRIIFEQDGKTWASQLVTLKYARERLRHMKIERSLSDPNMLPRAMCIVKRKVI